MTRDLVPGFGQSLRRIRTEKVMSIDDLAKVSGVDRNSIARIEREERAPSLRIAISLAKGLGVSLDLLSGRWKEGDDVAGDEKPKAKGKGGKK
jgi:transcriptional regulator with XRE-family HTH domain